MADRNAFRGPFEAHPSQTLPTRDGAINVHLIASCLRHVTLLSTWPLGRADWLEALRGVFGPALPGQTGQVLASHLGLLMRTGPEEFLLVGDTPRDPLPLLLDAITAGLGSVTDLSHARCRIRIDGPRTLEALSKLFALDFRPAVFPVGEIRLTGHHHLPCTLHRLGDCAFDAYVFTSYAHDQLQTLLDAAREYGVTLSR